MTKPTRSGLLRIGDARRLTRASTDGPFTELNTSRKWQTPPE